MIKNLIFDLGNVILKQKINFGGDYFASMVPSYPREEVYAFYRNNKRDLISGNKSFREILENFKSTFGIGTPTEDLYKKFKESYIVDVEGVDAKVMKIVTGLNKKYSVYAMTNTIEPHFEYWETMGLDQNFKKIFRSDTDHFMKPDMIAYEYVLGKIGQPAKDCVFIDDLEKNVEGAKAVGIIGIVYANPAQLELDLAKIGVKI